MGEWWLLLPFAAEAARGSLRAEDGTYAETRNCNGGGVRGARWLRAVGIAASRAAGAAGGGAGCPAGGAERAAGRAGGTTGRAIVRAGHGPDGAGSQGGADRTGRQAHHVRRLREARRSPPLPRRLGAGQARGAPDVRADRDERC